MSQVTSISLDTSKTRPKVVIAITADKGVPKSKLDKLAKQTNLPLFNKGLLPDYLLHISTERLELQQFQEATRKKTKKPLSIFVDFAEGKLQYRRLHGGGKGQDIAKAIGLNKHPNATVLDLTAGMGGDAFVLATLGAQVTMIERNPVVHALLNDALERATLKVDAELQEVLSRLQLHKNDSANLLDGLFDDQIEKQPDVIYIDPMFPERSKSAQVKKEMQFFHDVVGADTDSEALFLKALKLAKKRIVVKRPRISERLTDQLDPAFVIQGKSTRYDVYLPVTTSE